MCTLRHIVIVTCGRHRRRLPSHSISIIYVYQVTYIRVDYTHMLIRVRFYTRDSG